MPNDIVSVDLSRPVKRSMSHIFEYLNLFFSLLSRAGIIRRQFALVAGCYLLITIFDLLGLGAIFFFVSQFLGFRVSQIFLQALAYHLIIICFFSLSFP